MKKVDFTIIENSLSWLYGGDYFKQSEAFSFHIATVDQEETDRYWNAIVAGGFTRTTSDKRATSVTLRIGTC